MYVAGSDCRHIKECSSALYVGMVQFVWFSPYIGITIRAKFESRLEPPKQGYC